LEDSDNEPDLLAVMNSQHEDSDVMAIDPETPERDEETKVGTRDGNSNNNEVMEDKGTGQYWSLKLKKEAQKVAMAVIYLDGGLLTHLLFIQPKKKNQATRDIRLCFKKGI